MQAFLGKAGQQAELIAWQGWQSGGRTYSFQDLEKLGRDHEIVGSGGAV